MSSKESREQAFKKKFTNYNQQEMEKGTSLCKEEALLFDI